MVIWIGSVTALWLIERLILENSGGHTAEMLNLLAVLDKDKFKPRFYISAITDSMSLQKAQVYEESIAPQNVWRLPPSSSMLALLLIISSVTMPLWFEKHLRVLLCFASLSTRIFSRNNYTLSIV